MGRILVVEDDEPLRGVIASVLQDEGHEVLTALGADALLLAESSGISLVILDLVLPLLPGGTIAAYLAEHPATKRIPVIVSSGLTDIAEPLRALGVRYWLPKPWDASELVAIVAKALYEAKCPGAN